MIRFGSDVVDMKAGDCFWDVLLLLALLPIKYNCQRHRISR